LEINGVGMETFLRKLKLSRANQHVKGKNPDRRIVVGSEKACRLYLHHGIVRGNKMQVNDK
jgi:hypothetical protein